MQRPRTAVQKVTSPRHKNIVYAQEIKREKEQKVAQQRALSQKSGAKSTADLSKSAHDVRSNPEMCEHAFYMEQNARDMLLKMRTKSFLHTNVTDYLNKSAKKVTCISCNKCVRKQSHLISYKYDNKLGSAYT